jgi:hypothetical protein
MVSVILFREAQVHSRLGRVEDGIYEGVTVTCQHISCLCLLRLRFSVILNAVDLRMNAFKRTRSLSNSKRASAI